MPPGDATLARRVWALCQALACLQGQIPSGVREEQLWALFRPYGSVRNLHLLKGMDSRPRGCAMCLYTRFSQAEAAADALNGKANLLPGQTRPLVVHFANPRRNPQGPPEPGIAPRKLFIGQVRCQVYEKAGDSPAWPPVSSVLPTLVPRCTRLWVRRTCRILTSRSGGLG